MSWSDVKDLTVLFTVVTVFIDSSTAYFNPRNSECGPYGYICESATRLRLCEEGNLIGPSFLCPAGTICNEDSNDVCENAVNYIDTSLRDFRCRRNERIADSSVPDCKGYVLCIPNKNRFQGIRFKCTGNTIFNGYTRTCTAPDKYKCPTNSTSLRNNLAIYKTETRRISSRPDIISNSPHGTRPIDCKNYNFKITDDQSPGRATYFCPSRPKTSGAPTKCTVFSNQFCIMLDRDDQDSFVPSGAVNRKPRYYQL